MPAPGASAPASVLCSSPAPTTPLWLFTAALLLLSCWGGGSGAVFLCLFFFNWVKSQIATVPGCQASPGPWSPEGSLPSSLGAPSSLRVCRDLSESVHGKRGEPGRREVEGGSVEVRGCRAAFGIALAQA